MVIGLLYILAVLSGMALLYEKNLQAYSYMDIALIACAPLLFVNSQLLNSYLSLLNDTKLYSTAAYGLFITSNHFMLSSDILFFLSIIMLVLYSALKLEGPNSAK